MAAAFLLQVFTSTMSTTSTRRLSVWNACSLRSAAKMVRWQRERGEQVQQIDVADVRFVFQPHFAAFSFRLSVN
jgi:hypothetical protein